MKYIFLFLIAINLVATPSLKQINSEFDSVSENYDIPVALLKALAYKQSSWNVNNGKTDTLNKGMYGIMGLYQDSRISSISYGSKLLNLDPIYALINYKWNIEVSAKIISEIKSEYIQNGKNIEKVEDYYNILIDYFDYDESIRAYSENLVIKIYKLINSGYTVKQKSETLNIPAQAVDVSAFKSNELNQLYLHYTQINSLGDIEFEYTDHFNERNGVDIDQVIIHIMQGYFEGTIGHFKHGNPRASSHYLVSREGEILQMVKLKDRAWHAGSHNDRSVGIEHAGFDSNPDFADMLVTEEEYQASAMLTKWLTEKYNIPVIHRDAYHDENGHFVPWQLQRPELAQLPGILGHHDTNGKELCPGPNWDWDYYMQLLNESSGEGEIEVLSPIPNQVVDNPVVFTSTVTGDIVKVKYFADGSYLLGESSNSEDNFRVEYAFNGIGERSVSFKGYDENDNMVSLATKTHNINIIEAGEGTVKFKTPLHNTETTNPVILEANVTGDVALVKYYAENRFFLGESRDKTNNFRIEKTFNQIGARVLNVKGFSADDVLITNAQESINVIVPKIDGTVIEECIPECDIKKETKCNANGNISICEEVEDCLVWQVSQECGGDEYCAEGKCERKETGRECNDECDFVGERECRANATQTCQLDKDNCLKFFLDETCKDGHTCNSGSCVKRNTNENDSSSDEGCSFASGKESSKFGFLFIVLLLLSIKLFKSKVRS